MSNIATVTSKRRIVISLAVIVAFAWTLLPFYWALTCSFKTPKDVFSPSYIPFIQFTPTLSTWLGELGRSREISLALGNSIIVAICSSLLAVLLGSLAGYGLARYKYEKLRNQDIVVWFLSQRMLPPVAIVIPFFLMMRSARLLDTRLALIFVNTTFNVPLSVLIMRSIFVELPESLEESAFIDGCSRLGAFFRITLPLSIPGLIAAFLICWAFSWNEFIFALTLTYKRAITIPVIVAGSHGTRGIEFWYLATRSLIAIIPPVIVALFLQRYLVRGLTFGALKE